MATDLMSQREFVLRRLHSLLGVIPLLPFLGEHMFTNSFASQGPEVYAEKVEFLTSLPFLPILEWGGILLPLAFHAVYGMYIIFTGAPTTRGVPYARNMWYILQRVSAVVMLFFIMVHLLAWRFGPLRAGGNDALFWDAMRQEFLHSPLFLGIYIVGFISVAFHVGNGLWTFALTWGIIVGVKAQRLWAWVCGAIGLGLLFVQVNAIRGMMAFPEQVLHEEYSNFIYNAQEHGASSMTFIFGGSIAGVIVAALMGIALMIMNRPNVQRAEGLL